MTARTASAAWAAVALSALLVLSGCGGGGGGAKDDTTKQPDANQQTEVPVPEGVQLTAYGTELKFGQPAVVAYAPNAERKSVLQLSVLSATKGAVADLGGYTLDERVRASTVYYVRVSIKNIGDGDVGQTPMPFYLVDNRTPKTLITASTFTNSFPKCPSTPLPTTFAPQAQLTACLVYLAPDHGSMSGVSFRGADQSGDQAVAPILWTGQVTVPPKTKPKKKKS